MSQETLCAGWAGRALAYVHRRHSGAIQRHAASWSGCAISTPVAWRCASAGPANMAPPVCPAICTAAFDRMIAETPPGRVIVTTKDCSHDDVHLPRAWSWAAT